MDGIARSIWYDNELYKKVEWHYPVGDVPDEFFIATGIVEFEDWCFMIDDASDYVRYLTPSGRSGEFLGG